MFTSILGLAPFILFGIPLLVIFGIFVSGAFTLFFAREPDRGKDVIAKALTYFLILLTLFLVFIVVSYLVGQGKIFSPEEEDAEFPMSPMGMFPEYPGFVMVEDFSFSRPRYLSEVDVIEESHVYGIFCKKEEGYDIIDMGINSSGRPISSSDNYQCWEENCNGSENIYMGVYWTPPDKPNFNIKAFDEIKKEVDFICSPEL